jgi:hypothetical protein
VVATDFVLIKGPTAVGWTVTVASTATNTITTRWCNNTGNVVSPKDLQFQYMIVQ